MTKPTVTTPEPRPPESKPPVRRPWVAPAIEELPRLTELTLQSPEFGHAIEGSGGPGGSVF